MKGKKILAATLAATMVMGSVVTVSATDSGSQEAHSSGSVDVIDLEALEVWAAVLPTVGDSTYTFKYDPEAVLSKYDTKNYEANKTLFFNNVVSEGEIQVASGQAIYELQRQEMTLADLTIAINTNGAAGVQVGGVGDYYYDAASTTALPANKYFVWVPHSTLDGEGEYKALTKENLEVYFDITMTDATTIATIAPKPGKENLAGAAVCDGKVYTDVYESLTAVLPANKYGSFAKNAVSKLYDFTLETKGDGSATAGYTPLYKDNDGKNTAAVLDTDFEVVTPYDCKLTDKSMTATVVNKSTYAVDVKAEFTAVNVAGLTFSSTATNQTSLATGDDDIFLLVKATASDNTDTAAKDVYFEYDEENEVAVASVSYLLDAGNAALVYQTDATDSKTGGHIYKQFIKNPLGVAAFPTANFTITGATQKKVDSNGDETTTHWNEYAKSLASVPKIDVVYSVEKHQDGPKATMTAAGVITITGLTATANVTGYNDVLLTAAGETFSPTAATASFDGSAWSAAAGGTAVFNLGSQWASWNGKSVSGTVKLTDGTTITISAVTLAI